MKLKQITYLDNAAAMPISKDILDSFKEYSLLYYANPEAVHGAGREAMLAIKDSAASIIENITGKGTYSLFFTASATEAINIAVTFPRFKDKVIVTTDAEHSAMRSAIEGAGFCEIRKVSIGKDGMVDLNDLERKLDDDVTVVSMHHIQNETGASQNLKEIRSIIDRKSPGAVFMVDTVQSVGKIPIPWKEAKINIGFIGGHKVGAPTGGALIHNLPGDIGNLFYKYLNTIRSFDHSIGRPDTSVCLALADAVKRADLSQLGNIRTLNQYMRGKLADFESNSKINLQLAIPEDVSSPYIISFLIPPYQAEVLVRMLSDEGVMVSAGSACEASKSEPSSTLLAMGISSSDARTAMRVSFSFDSNKNDVDRFIEAFKRGLKEY